MTQQTPPVPGSAACAQGEPAAASRQGGASPAGRGEPLAGETPAPTSPLDAVVDESPTRLGE